MVDASKHMRGAVYTGQPSACGGVNIATLLFAGFAVDALTQAGGISMPHPTLSPSLLGRFRPT